MNSLAPKSNLNIVSFFAGCGGLDLGFAQAGFKTIWANEWDKEIWQTFQQPPPALGVEVVE